MWHTDVIKLSHLCLCVPTWLFAQFFVDSEAEQCPRHSAFENVSIIVIHRNHKVFPPGWGCRSWHFTYSSMSFKLSSKHAGGNKEAAFNPALCLFHFNSLTHCYLSHFPSDTFPAAAASHWKCLKRSPGETCRYFYCETVTTNENGRFHHFLTSDQFKCAGRNESWIRTTVSSGCTHFNSSAM